MMSTETSIAERAQQMRDAFETATRPDGERFVRLRDGSPEWMKDVAYAAHGNGARLPDDWTYEAIRNACEAITEGEEEGSGEWADSQVDTYNAGRIKWLATFPDAIEACDEAQSEGLAGEGVLALIAAGQFQAAAEIFAAVFHALEEVDA